MSTGIEGVLTADSEKFLLVDIKTALSKLFVRGNITDVVRLEGKREKFIIHYGYLDVSSCLITMLSKPEIAEQLSKTDDEINEDYQRLQDYLRDNAGRLGYKFDFTTRHK